VAIEDVDLVHPESAATLPSGPEWRYELKYDGFRALGDVAGGVVRIRYRNGGDGTAAWPEITSALLQLGTKQLVVDGELVVPDARGRPRFELVQARARRGASTAARAAREKPGLFCVFDLLAAGGADLRSLPYVERKRELRRIPQGVSGALHFVDDCGAELAEALFARSREAAEGVIAKRASSPYRNGAWVKVKHDETSDFVVIGYSIADPALHLGAYVGKDLVYVGRVHAGFVRGALRDMAKALEQLAVGRSPCAAGPAPLGVDRFVEPRVVVEIAYVERTRHGVLRHARFVRLRTDKRPEECRLGDQRS
jgi:bifunctional non-homologous end joining protein LigD